MSFSCDLSAHRQKSAAQDAPDSSLLSYTDAEAEQHAAEVGARSRPMETKNEINAAGAFVRQPNAFTAPAGEGEGEWKPEANRYRLYWAKGCNWSNRPAIVIELLGLSDTISNILVTPSGQSNTYGWGFADQKDHKDPATGAYFLSQFYQNARPDFQGRATTPTLVDVREKKAVNNDYHRLTNYLEVQFRPFQPKDAPDLYPKAFRREIDELNDWMFPHINNGHYRMAFCQSLEAYQEAFDDFYDSMDKLDKRLASNRFLFGDYVTDSDIRFFVTLVRWDISYFRNIGPVKHRIVDYPHIWPYAKELYAIPAFRHATYFHDLSLGHDNKDEELFADWNTRIANQIDFAKLWDDSDIRAERASLSADPDHKFLLHPADEKPEEYITKISASKWNSPDEKDRTPGLPGNGELSVDASVNPLKGKI